MDFRSIRTQSLAALRARGLVAPNELPLLEEAAPKSHDEIVARMFCLNAVAAGAHGFDRKRAIDWLDREQYRHKLTPAERAFLEQGQGDAPSFAVQVEGLWALAWVMSIVDQLDFWSHCSNDFVRMLPDLRIGEDTTRTLASAKLRTTADTVAACDLHYCLHWKIRDAQLRGLRPPITSMAYWIVERRRALEWVLYQDDWDNISLDT